MSDRIDWAV